MTCIVKGDEPSLHSNHPPEEYFFAALNLIFARTLHARCAYKIISWYRLGKTIMARCLKRNLDSIALCMDVIF